MDHRIDLADPAFEPTDLQLQELSRRAFAGVGAAHAESLARLRAEIERERARVLKAIDDAAAPRSR